MTLDRYFKLSSYTLLATGTALLVATRQLDLVSLTVFIVALSVAGVMDCGGKRWWETKDWVNWLLVGWLLVALGDWYILGSAPASVIIRFILFSVALRLLREKRERDWLWLYTVSFLQVLFAAGLMMDTIFLVLLIVYLFAALSTLVSFELHRAQRSFAERNPASDNRLEFWRAPRQGTLKEKTSNSRKLLKPPRWRSVSLFSGVALLLIFLLAAPLFLAMPRLARAFPNNLLRTDALSGFSETVRLGEVARIKLNPQVVMRVRVKFPRGQEQRRLRWRGLALDLYESGNWFRTAPPPIPLPDIGGSFQVNPSSMPHTEQEFYLEPLNTGIIFAAPRAIWVSGVDFLKRDVSDTLWTDHHAFYKFRYTVSSDTREPDVAALQADLTRFYPAEIRRPYLQLPKPRDTRMEKLAELITRDATSPYESARAIEKHLQETYQYSLDLQPVEEGDPVSDFLFNTRTGHCEYFASAMVLLLRMRGIPARLVNGFQMGEYSEVADAYTVRQADAHSWVEAYFPKHGWVAFDPTPAAGLNRYSDDWLAWMRHYSDAMQMFWQERIVGFDSAEQLSMLLAAQRQLRRLRSESDARWWDWKQKLNEWLGAGRNADSPAAAPPTEPESLAARTQPLAQHPMTWAFLGLLMAGIAGFAWWRYTHSWQYRLKHDTVRSAIAFYQEMLDTLARAGQRKAAAQTPLEFATQLNQPAVAELTRLYQQARFGRGGLNTGEVARVGVLLQSLKHKTTRFRR